MKKRNRMGSRNNKSRFGRQWLSVFEKKAVRRQRAWTFEQLEARQYFTATPLSPFANWQWMSVSNSTAQGQQVLDAIEQMWADEMSSTGGQGSASAEGSGSTSSGSQLTARSLPTDPYLSYQWHLLNVGQVVNPGQFQNLYGVPGQDINVAPAWDDGWTGAGVNVAVVDDAVQINHPDLEANIAKQYAYDAIYNRPGFSITASDTHGTAVAGLIGAVANNNEGGAGVAYGATLIPIRMLGDGASSQSYINAIGANGAPVDIYNNSWGPADAGAGGTRGVDPMTPAELQALSISARLGRNGLGAIHVFAAGNGAEALDSAGSDGYVNSRYTIAVGIVDHDGQVRNSDGTSTRYGEMAPSVLVVAPSASGPTDIINDFNTGSGIFTTDRTNGLGYNIPPTSTGLELDIDAFPNEDYTSRFGGTSAAAPLVSGVIALMLQANPNLTYRDVQEILVRSARQNDDQDTSWITNLVPLFRDPLQHSFGQTNYPNTSADPPTAFYPSDESDWNDEIVYMLRPAMETTPAKQASTDYKNEQGTLVKVEAANSTFTIKAKAKGAWDGWVANNLTVVFDTEPTTLGMDPMVDVAIVSGKLRITVYGDGITWGDIKAAVEDLGEGNDKWFTMTVSDANGLFMPEDEAILAPLSGGVDPTGTGSVLVRNPMYQGYNPIADPITNPEPLSLFTNGAGYTVSHGRGGNSEYGWAHGVVDAGLAVELAKQWHTKDQNLPSEKTYLVGGSGAIRLRGAEVTSDESGKYLIPGALSWSTDSFAEYYNEFFKEVTFTEAEDEDDPDTPEDETVDRVDADSLPFNGDDPPANTRGAYLTFDVPAIDPVTGASNLMSLEWVEVKLNISGDADAMNFVRVVLVSPEGTQSELTQNQYSPGDIDKNFQNIATGGIFTSPGDSITNTDENGGSTDTLNWVYSTNRIWGERSDSKIVYDEYGNLTGYKGWELHFENYSGSDLTVSGVSIAFHGSPIGSSTAPVERVMGKVGVDSGRYIPLEAEIVGANDGEFNFDRYITVPWANSNAPSGYGSASSTPFGEHEVRIADPNQESFVGNATVYVIDNNPDRASFGQRIAQFVTGADGNYYFDLPAGDYIVGVEDSLGRTALADGRNFDNEWNITIDGQDLFTREAGYIDEVSGKVKFYDNLNFLLDPGSVPAGSVVFEGQVVGDLNGNAVQDATDVGVYNFLVYADLNHTGQFELGEPFTYTDAEGNYSLEVPTATPNTFSIIVKPPAGWTPTAPVSATISEYAKPGDLVDGFKFMFEPPSSPSGEGNGTIFGLVFDDRNGDGIQQVNEKGLAGFKVFVDADLDGQWDEDEVYALTSSTGAYQFGDVILGGVRLDVVINEPYILTSPAAGFINLDIEAGEVAQNNNFAVRNLATNDFGDLIGAGYGTANATHFVVQGFTLGAKIDTEVRPRYQIVDSNGNVIVDPNVADALGDDQEVNEASFDDEDGVTLLGGFLRPGANTFEVVVNGVGGYLQAWVDFNNDGTFGAGEQVLVDEDLVQGTHQLVIQAPANLTGGQSLATRFRWGTMGMGFTGHDTIGEIEDYRFTSKAPIAGDFTGDDVVDDADYQLWRSTFGSAVDLRADANKNGVVDSSDYTIWRNNYGNTAPSGGGGGALAAAVESLVSASGGASLAAITIDNSLPTLASAFAVNEAGTTTDVSQSADVVIAATVVGPSSVGVSTLDLISANVANDSGQSHASSELGTPAATAAERVDLALLMLAAHDVRGDHESNSLSSGALTAGDADLDLALAAVFEEETNWRIAL